MGRVWIGAGLSLLLLAGPAAAKDAGPGTGGASAAVRPDRARLGMTEAEVRAIYGPALREEKIVAPVEQGSPIPLKLALPKSAKPAPQTPPAAPDPYANQRLLVRSTGGGDVTAVEYLFYRGRLYRIRWTLADRFEQPIVEELVTQGTKRFGEPAYDQNIVRKPGSPRANLRRTAWERGGRALEIRQINPVMGGAMYVTLSDGAAIRKVVAARGIVAPEPETAGSWWLAKRGTPRLPTPEQREALTGAVWRVVAETGF